MLQSLTGRKSFALVTLQGAQDEGLALLTAAAGHLDGLVLDVILALERETTSDHTENNNAQGPTVDLGAVVQGIELRAPVRLGAALLSQASVRLKVHDRAKIAEVDACVGVLHLLSVLQVVVALQVAVDDVVLMEPIDSLEHHLRYVLDAWHRDDALGLPMQLHALDHVATTIDFQDHADKDLLVVDVVQLHHTRVRKPLEHFDLLLDLGDRGLDLIDHLNCVLVIAALLLAGVNDSECALSEDFA
mmetsp:Transcript_79589/g.165313  ORF Transcript_79589/g.165313 Transcript_79589/m.165313 type:complete len:246 (+) Transcript_79589:1521-2258(+)